MTAWRFARSLAAALLVALPAFARADDAVPSAAAIRANARAAEHEPNAYRETIVTTSSDGTTTTEHHLVRGADDRTIDDSPPFHAESGNVHGLHWLQDENGITLDDRPDPGHAKPEALTTTVSRVHVPVDAYAIATLNAKGRGRAEYVDPASWQVVRRERIAATGTVTTTYDDVRDDGGRVFAHHWRVEDAITETTRESRVTEYAPGDVTEDELARPASLRALVTFPEGAVSVDLPVRFGTHIYVTVRINGLDLRFVLDSGASGIALDSEVARRLNLKLYGEHAHVVAGKATIARAIVPQLRIGELAMRNVAVGVVPLGWTERRAVRMAGLLGFDFFAQLGVTVDYEHRRVSVVPSSAYVPPREPHTSALPARFGRGIPLVTASFDGAVAERVGLDTGGGGSFLLFDYFTRRNPKALADDDRGASARTRPLVGVGGAFTVAPALAHSVELGDFRLPDVSGYRVTSDRAYAQDIDGVIGDQLLRWFTLGLDYAHERIYLTPNREGRRALRI